MSKIKHLVMEVDEVIVHIYTTNLSRQLLKEAKKGKGEPLSGVYFYQKHKPHTQPGQNHLHVYEKQNQLFAINWDGTAHDQSHGITIPRRVYDALKVRFPDLKLPGNRIIESFSPLPVGRVFKSAAAIGLSAQELVALQQLLIEETGESAGIELEPPSRTSFFAPQRIPFVGQPYMLMAAEYRDDGALGVEGYLFWSIEQRRNRKPECRIFQYSPDTVKMEIHGERVFDIAYAEKEVLQWAYGSVETEVMEVWEKKDFGFPLPQHPFAQYGVIDVVRVWRNGMVTTDLRQIRKTTQLTTLASFLDPILKLKVPGEGK